MATSRATRVVIVGGGASGVIAAAHLLRRAADGFHVTIVERSGTLGRGLAYTTSHPGHLLNVRLANMSAFADDPDHLLRWLRGRTSAIDPSHFIERRIYGEYLADLLTEFGSIDRLRIVSGEVQALAIGANEACLQLRDGESIDADAVVLATGNEAPVAGGVFADPWRNLDHGGAHGAGALLIRGTGLTMVDYVLWLVSAGHAGPIYAISRRGKLPREHKVVLPRSNVASLPADTSLSSLLRWLRQAAAREQDQGGDWRNAVDAIRPHSWRIWRSLTLEDQRRFLRHARPWWDIHRHRMAPQVAQNIRRVMASGQLQIIPGRIQSVETSSDGHLVTIKRRGSKSIETLRAREMIDCSGFNLDIVNSKNPLVSTLLQAGLARPDPLGIGLDVNEHWQVVSREGVASTRIFAVGPLTRGSAWETIAVPDIRNQSAEIVATLAEKARAVAA